MRATRRLAFSSVLALLALCAGIYFYHNYKAGFDPSTVSVQATQGPAASQPALNRAGISENYGKLPINFEPNVGQVESPVDFLARGNGYSLFLTGNEAVLRLNPRDGTKPAAIRMTMPGSNATPKGTGLNQTEGKTNYFIGSDPASWRTDVANYAKVKYDSVYDGIDLVYYGNGQQLEYDFTVSPNTDPNQIRLKFTGITRAEIELETGDLILSTAGGTVRQHRPVVYQEAGGMRTEIASSYKIAKAPEGETEVGFVFTEYDRSKELVIDPVLTYGTYLGGNKFDEGGSITADAEGNAYVVGTAASLDFPTTAGALKTTNPASTNGVQWYDAFVTKLNPSGTAIIFSTYFGGRNASESGTGVALDPQGNVIFSGTTMANDMPVVNAYQGTFGGTDDGFAAKLNPAGSALIYSTYLGGNNTDSGKKIAVNAATGDTVFVGSASSGNFPTTPGAFKERLCTGGQSCNGIFYYGSYIVKLTGAGNIIYSTLFDASLTDITLDSGDNATVGGNSSTSAGTGTSTPTTPGSFQPASSGGIDGYIAKLNPAGNALVYGTFLGGGLQSDYVSGITLDAADNIYVTGRTENTGFPTTPGVLDRTFNGGEDGFVTKLNSAGTTLIYSTFLGAVGKDQPFAIGLGTDNDPFITGETTSGVNFPLRNSFLATGTIFLTRLNQDASAIVYSTYLGLGGGYDIAVDAGNNAYVTGHTTNILITPNAVQTVRNRNEINIEHKDGYAVKIAPTDENATTYAISGIITDPNYGYTNNTWPSVATITGTVNRQVNIPYSGGPYYFGALPAGGNYTVTVRRTGYVVTPESAVFNGLGANQFADFAFLRNQEPEGVVTGPAHGTTYTFPATINITATASDPDGDAIAKVDFVAYNSTVGSVPLGTDTTAPYEVTWSNAGIGTWSINAYPTDSKGLRGYSTPVVHVFVVDGGAPAVAITSPSEGQAFVEGAYVPISLNVSSSITRAEVRDQNNNLVAWLTGQPWASTWRVMTVGNYTLTATAFNAQNQSATSTVNIVVNRINHRITGRVIDSIFYGPIPNVTVNLTSPTNPSITATTTTDSNGSYLFTDLGTTVNDGVVITPTLPGYTFNPASRSIAYLGYVDWNDVFVGTAQNSITVNMTSPTGGQTFIAPATINLAADASSGAGTITKVEFYRQQGAQEFLLATDTGAPFELQLTGVPAGSYEYYARATDSTNAVQNSAAVAVTVTAAAATVRLQGDITSPGGGFMPGITVLLTGTVNGSPISQASVSNNFGAYGFFNLPGGGNYTLTPQVTNGMTFTPPSASFTNVTSDNLDVDFLSSASNQSPSVQINSPANGAVFAMPVEIPVSASATDPDGRVTRLTLTANSPTRSYSIGQTLGGTFSAPWQPVEPGNYTIWATALDNGGFSTSTSIQITVNPPAPVSVSGRIVDRNSVGIEGVTLTLKNYQDDTVITTAATDATGNYTVANLATFTSYTLTAAKHDYTFTPQRRTYLNLSASQTNGDFTGTLQVPMADFDGDGEADISVWRPSDGVWHIMRSNDDSYTALQFGGGAFGDVVTPGNFDGDRKTDYAVFRNGLWFIRNSGNEQVWARQFGMAGDKPVAGDYDGDGKTDVAVWRPSDGVWYIVRSLDGNYDFRQFGMNGDIPLAGDYDGDGIADLTVFRPSEGNWYVLRSSDGQFYGSHFGLSGDIPLVGDFDGDKKCDFTVFRPSEGNWYVLKSTDGGFTSMHWGLSSDVPVPGDYDKDGKTDFAVFRGSEGNWYIFLSLTSTYKALHFGATGDVPVPAAYVR